MFVWLAPSFGGVKLGKEGTDGTIARRKTQMRSSEVGQSVMTGYLSRHSRSISCSGCTGKAKRVTTFVTHLETHLPQMSAVSGPTTNESDRDLFLVLLCEKQAVQVGYGVEEERERTHHSSSKSCTPPCTADSTGHGIKPRWDQR